MDYLGVGIAYYVILGLILVGLIIVLKVLRNRGQ